MLQLQRLLLMLPLSAGITLSLLFSLSLSLSFSFSFSFSRCSPLVRSFYDADLSDGSVSPRPILCLSFLLRTPSLPIQLHFLRHDVAAVLSLHVHTYSTRSSTTKTRRTSLPYVKGAPTWTLRCLASLRPCLWFCYRVPLDCGRRGCTRTRAVFKLARGRGSWNRVTVPCVRHDVFPILPLIVAVLGEEILRSVRVTWPVLVGTSSIFIYQITWRFFFKLSNIFKWIFSLRLIDK